MKAKKAQRSNPFALLENLKAGLTQGRLFYMLTHYQPSKAHSESLLLDGGTDSSASY